MSEIKTRENVKGIKALDKSVDLGQRMKKSLVKTKDRVQSTAEDHHGSAEEYASDKVEELEGEAVSRTTDGVQNTVQRGKDAYRHHREKVKAKQEAQTVPEYQRPMRESAGAQQQQRTVRKPSQPTQAQNQAEKASRKSIKTMDKSGKTIRQSANSAGKQTARAGRRTVKTAEQSSKMAIKTAKQAEKAAQNAAKASAKAAQKTAKATAKAAKSAGSAVAKTASATLKAIVAGMAKLIAAIAAGGWVAILIIVIVGVVAMIASSCFGLFAGWDDRPDLKAVMQSINEEYNSQIEEIKNSNIYDELELNGTRASWKEVLAVYSVVVTTDAENPQEVTSMTDEKEIMLTNIFWEMNSVTYSFRLDTVYETIEVEDGAGGVREEIEERQATILVIIVNHKSAWDIADQMHFTDEQREMLEQMLSSENDSMWSKLLYGVYGGSTDIVEVALSQIGNVGGEPYWRWYGFENRVSWCHAFVCWCADQCGYIEAGIVPMTAYCPTGVDWFTERGEWLDGNAEPVPGLIIYFDWEPRDGYADHVGIVEKIENGLVYTIEGNTSDSCAERWYPIGDACILGYGAPAYE